MDKFKNEPPSPDTAEITSLNVEALDVEELERRLEMAAAEVTSAAWICGTNDNTCQPVCGTNNPCSPVVKVPIDVLPGE